MEEKLKKLLDDYYGDHRNDDHKEEIIAFIESNQLEIFDILLKLNAMEAVTKWQKG
jgi:hypothetical protein